MSSIVRIGKSGRITLPREVLDSVKTDSPYEVQVEGNTLRLSPVQEEQPLWATLSPKERAEEFRQWVRNLTPKARHLSDEAMRRENMYD